MPYTHGLAGVAGVGRGWVRCMYGRGVRGRFGGVIGRMYHPFSRPISDNLANLGTM